MNSDPASLDNLRDIVTPDPVSWWPLAPGWWVVILAGCLLAAIGAWRGVSRWRANAYRREALAKLGSAESIADVACLLKRTALGAYPRSSVASLTGEAWCRFLTESSREPMPQDVSKALTRDLFRHGDSDASDSLRSYAVSWIRNHRLASVSRPTRGETDIDEVEGTAC